MALALAVPVAAAEDAHVRVPHGSPDAPSVEVCVNDEKVDALSGIEFGDLTDDCGRPRRHLCDPLPGGSYDLKVCANADNTVCPLDPAALDLANGTAYSVFAIGSLGARPSPRSSASTASPPRRPTP